MSNLSYYKEVQGVMTRFEPLTAAALEKASVDLTIAEIQTALEQHGLDFKYIVHDPSRSLLSTYYADYGRGLYMELYLHRNILDKQFPLYQVADELKGAAVPELTAGAWKSYYTKRVPLAMQIYDFQRRYRDIPTDEVFLVWHDIYKRIDYSNRMWPAEVLEYVENKSS